MKTVSCLKCGTVVDTDVAPRIAGVHKGMPQSSVHCPVCSTRVYCEIDGQNTCAPGYDDRTEEQKIMAKAANDARAKLKANDARAKLKAKTGK